MSLELIQYRRERARETLDESRLLLEKNKTFGAVNRMYYALFYEITALLLAQNLISSKHSGVMSLFQKEFVKTEKVPKEQGKFFARLFSLRQKGDYGDFCDFEEIEVREWFKEAEQLMQTLEDLITNTLLEE